MPEIPISVWLQYPVALIVLGAVLLLLKEFKAFIEKRDEQWQGFLRDQRQEEQVILKDLVEQVRKLAEQLVALRGDFDRTLIALKSTRKGRQDG